MLAKIWILFFAALFANGDLCAQIMNARISDPSLNSPEEVTIAINPKNPLQIAAGSNLNYLYTSYDGGLSWNSTTGSSQYGFWGDPCVMYDDSGILYYEHLSGVPNSPDWLERIVVQHSTDAGVTFDSGAQIGYYPPTMQDKSWLGLDRSPTKSKGTIFTSWNEDDFYGSRQPSDSSRIFFSESTDQGQTWSDRVRVDSWGGDCIDSSNTVEGAVTASGKDGAVNIVWSGHNKIYFNRSTDGGKTFGKDKPIADQPNGWDIFIPGIFRVNGFPMIVSDLNKTSPYYGRLIVMWTDTRRGVADIYSIYSADNGSTWSNPIRVNSDSAKNHHFFPSITIDPVTSNIYIVSYDRRNYLDSETDVYLARSTDGGASFEDRRISQSAFSPDAKIFFGDYIHVAALNGKVYPIWMRMDTKSLSVWTAIVTDTGPWSRDEPQAEDTIPTSTQLLVTGGMSQPGIAFTLPGSQHVLIEMFDLLGRKIATLIDGFYGSGEFRLGIPQSVANAAYIVRMTTNDGVLMAKLGVAR